MIEYREITIGTRCPGISASISARGVFLQSGSGMGAGHIPARYWAAVAADIQDGIDAARDLEIEPREDDI